MRVELQETVICLAHDQDLIGMLGMSDAVCAGAAAVVQQLRALGVSRLILLTGDHATARHPRVWAASRSVGMQAQHRGPVCRAVPVSGGCGHGW
ncbi:hypothetical protein [Streptomyces sp.]|uniref:hypothetical protein n=1 Tax=Streptomyces sp. TaxID=1931 RepID=UPI002F93B857